MPSRRSKLIVLALACFAAFAAPAPASVSIYVPPERLAPRALLVVEGTVVRTASGFDPVERTVATYVTLEVERVHRGPSDLRRLVLREPGGRHAGLVHEVDAVPSYAVGEQVFVFLEPGPGGALRTAGMFFGKFRIETPAVGATEVIRDLGGQGTIWHAPADPVERFTLADLESIVASTGPERARPSTGLRRFGRSASRDTQAAGEAPSWTEKPTEFARLLWEEVVEAPGAQETAEDADSSRRVDLAPTAPVDGAAPRFVVSEPDFPSRWEASDTGDAIAFNIQRTGNPLGSGIATVEQMRRAMAAWTDVPESRLAVETGNTFYNYTGSVGKSPRAHYSGINVILFDDPYGEIADPVDCGGVLAVGGYWRAASINPNPVNNVQFYAIMQAYVIFNNDFECYLGIADNLAEVAAHEIGHGLGFGHSTEADAIMRAHPYGNRGPRLGDDDRDAAHCHYPHTLALLAPNGGESWAAGSNRQIRWGQTEEAGPDPGVVDVEYSIDGGATWANVAGGTPNDGVLNWVVPYLPGEQTRVRVLRFPRGAGVQPPYPEACSGDASDGSFAILGGPHVAGEVPDGSTGAPLRIAAPAAGQLRLEWAPSCSPHAVDYAVYSGSLESLRAGVWDHGPVTCGAGGLVAQVSPAAGDRYFLISPLAGSAEGDFGLASSGSIRPESVSACGVRQSGQGCGD